VLAGEHAIAALWFASSEQLIRLCPHAIAQADWGHAWLHNPAHWSRKINEKLPRVVSLPLVKMHQTDISRVLTLM